MTPALLARHGKSVRKCFGVGRGRGKSTASAPCPFVKWRTAFIGFSALVLRHTSAPRLLASANRLSSRSTAMTRAPETPASARRFGENPDTKNHDESPIVPGPADRLHGDGPKVTVEASRKVSFREKGATKFRGHPHIQHGWQFLLLRLQHNHPVECR